MLLPRLLRLSQPPTRDSGGACRAGLRSFDRTMPEEINRIVTDALADYLFTTEPSGEENLLREGVPASKIFFTGNVMIDMLLRFREKAARSSVLSDWHLEPRSYAVATMHRPRECGRSSTLQSFAECPQTDHVRIPVFFPVHPRTRQRIDASGVNSSGIVLAPPQLSRFRAPDRECPYGAYRLRRRAGGNHHPQRPHA